MSKKSPAIDPGLADNPDFNNLVRLLAIFSEGTNRNTEMQAEIDKARLHVADEFLDDYAENQKAITAAEAAIEVIVTRNPHWFEKRKTLKTPYGEVKVTPGTRLEIASEDATIRLIKASDKETFFIRVTEELDRESLEKLDDKGLAEYGIVRKKTQGLKITPATVDLGEAVKQSQEAAK